MKMIPSAAAVSLTLLFTSCEPGESERARLNELQTLRQDIRTMQDQSDREAADNRAIKASLRQAQEDAAKREQQATAERDAAQKKLEEVKKAFDDYRAKYRITARAPGQKFAKMDCGEGNVYNNVEIIEVTPGEMRFHHDAGTAKVALGMIERPIRERLDYDPMEAEAWLASHSPKKSLLDKDDDDIESITGKISRSSPGKTTASTSSTRNALATERIRKRYETDLSSLYRMARALQADQNCCPVHKKYQLASWSQEAAQLKKRLASLPSGG